MQVSNFVWNLNFNVTSKLVSITKTDSSIFVTSLLLNNSIHQFDLELNYLRNFSTQIKYIKEIYFDNLSKKLLAVDVGNEKICVYSLVDDTELIYNYSIPFPYGKPRSLLLFKGYLYVSDESRNIMIIDENMQLVKTFSNVCAKNNSWVLSLQFDSLGHLIYSCNHDNQIYIMDQLNFDILGNLSVDSYIYSAYLDSKNRMIVCLYNRLKIFYN